LSYLFSAERHVKLANADAMCWLPLPYTPDETAVPEELVLMVKGLQDAPITDFQIVQ